MSIFKSFFLTLLAYTHLHANLISVQTPTETIEYSYDVNNNRIAKEINNQTTNYLIDPNTPYAKVLQESNATDTISYTYGNTLINQISGVNTYTYHTDALGSTRYLTDQDTQTKAKYNYDAYGNLLKPTNQEVTNNFLYTGEQLDSETQNYYLRARYYDPQTTRFITRDTYDGVASNPITQNHYLYGNANPSMYVDPSGNMGMVGAVASTFAIGELATISLQTGAVAGGVLFQLRANKEYFIKRPSTEVLANGATHFYLEIKSKNSGNYRYDVYANKGGVLLKQSMNSTFNGSSFVRLSPLQFKVWEQGAFWRHPKHPNYHDANKRSYPYHIIFASCMTWTYTSWLSAVRIMLTVPSI